MPNLSHWYLLLLHHDFWFLSYKQSLHYFARSPLPAGSMSVIIMLSLVLSHELPLKFILSLCFSLSLSMPPALSVHL